VRYLQLSAVNHAPTWANTYAVMFQRAARALARNAGLPAAFAVLLALAAVVVSRGVARARIARRLRPLLPLAAYAVLLVAAYTLVVFGPWYYGRYFYPLLIPTVLAVAVIADELLRSLGTRRALGLVAVALLVVAGSLADPKWRATLTPGAPRPWGYLRIGEWAAAHVPPGTILGSSQTGSLGYFADRLTVVNLDGVVNREAQEAMRRRDLLGYIRRAGIRELLWQDDIGMIQRESRGGDPRAISYVGDAAGVETEGLPWGIYRVAPDSAAAVDSPK
jgi:hypothetical protein